MKRILLTLIICLLWITPLNAQDDSPTPYEIALQRIEETRVSGATELDLSRLGLTELPPEIGRLIYLRELYLSYNQLSTLPAEIEQLTSLHYLDLSSNRLSDFPLEISQLTNLKGLFLSFNQLSALPPEIGQLTNLEELRLSYNQLNVLPPEIGQLGQLCNFDLRANNLRRLPPELAQLSRLETREGCVFYGWFLAIEGNPFVYPPPEVVEQGTIAILDYLQADYERQQAEKTRLIIFSALGVGLVALFMLGFRYKQRGGLKPKKKRETAA